MKIKRRQIERLQTALNHLDGQRVVEEVTADGAQVRIPVFRPYEFTAESRLRFGRILGALNALADELADLCNTVKDGDDARWQAILDEEVDLDAEPFSASRLNLDTNPIPVSVISLLAPLLTED